MPESQEALLVVCSGCGFDTTIACPASCGSDGFPNYSEVGDAACGPRIGFTAAVWFDDPKAWPRAPPIMGPWWDVAADASLGGYTRIHDAALVNWPEQDTCGCRHFAITPNPSADDLTPTAFVSGVAAANVAEGAQYHSPPADPSRATFDNCVDFECTGLNHAVLVDTDGSLMGSPASVIRGDPALAVNDTRTRYSAQMDAIVVTGGSYRELYFESLDPDRKSRRVQPVAVAGVGAEAGRGGFARLNCFEDHLWDFDYTSLLRLSRFAATVELGGAYTITYAGTPPQQQQISMSGNAQDEGILVRLKCASADAPLLPLQRHTDCGWFSYCPVLVFISSGKRRGLSRQPACLRWLCALHKRFHSTRSTLITVPPWDAGTALHRRSRSR